MRAASSGPIPVVMALIAGLAASGEAQFFGLGTPADGSSVYFSATPSLRGKATWGKLFQVDSSGLRPVEARDYEVPDPPPAGYATGPGLAHPTNPYDIRGADISSDGRVLAVAAWRGCGASDPTDLYYCSKMENYYTTITAGTQSADYPGDLRLSANEQWAFGPGSHGPAEDGPALAYLVNVRTGGQTLLTDGSPSLGLGIDISTSGRSVANDGTAVLSTKGGSLVILRGQETLDISVGAGTPTGAAIDAAGQTVVFAVCGNAMCSPNPGTLSLYRADAVSGSYSLLTTSGYAPSMTDDGRKVLYTSTRSGTPQLRIMQTDGTGDHQLTQDPAGIASAILSGDGNVAYAVTLSGRLIKIAVASGAV